ncbi:PP2C family protein-serine/threonine phosphatase [Amphibiibacter pelophylacis]|uniref:PP2C family serine/threonine-protein phosphatase n=1 Tax=Amphibiibacter pelophylacis TaxID=1799477 RepID=A0ACC6NY97_9BURK
MRFSVFQMSRTGGRARNEDRVGYTYTRDSALFLLGDGMGGHADGDKAAQMALHALSQSFHEQAAPELDDPAAFLREGMLLGHRRLQALVEGAHPDTSPRTTLVGCVLQRGRALWAHCGDSRLYALRGGVLLSRTRDHSYAELQSRLVPGARAGESLNRNVLYTCLGSPGEPVIDLSEPLPLQVGDRFLLCSDGLWEALDDSYIARSLAQPRDLAQILPPLVDEALELNGERGDNVSALAVEWQG